MNVQPIESDDGSSLSYGDFRHLTQHEWEALRRLAGSAGIAVVVAMLTATPEAQQRNAIQELMTRELADLRRRVSTPSAPSKAEVVKLDVACYSGEGTKRLALNRWLCEVDIAVQARQLTGEFARTHFLLSKLSGKAKEWALGKLVVNPSCFPTMDSLKNDLRLAFEPPQDETQHRAAFLALRQGRSSMIDYIQRARHLASCVVTSPIDTVTQVHVFVSGMNAGHQRFYLTRKPPASLEEAFTIALREDYSVMASRTYHSQPAWADPEPEPMEVDTIVHTAPKHRGANSSRDRQTTKKITCFRCRKLGHRAAECRAPAPELATIEARNENADEPKNGIPPVAGHLLSPAVLHEQLFATTSSSDKRLIVLSLHVGGAQRPLRALLDSSATNNFVRADSLSVLPSRVRVREHAGEMVVKYADGQPRSLPRRSVSFAYEFDDFEGVDEFLVVDLGGSFDCVFGMPWLARHQPDVDWLNRTVKPRDIDVGAVLACISQRASNWAHVAVVDPDSTTLTYAEESDGPSCVACYNATCAPSVEQRLPSGSPSPDKGSR